MTQSGTTISQTSKCHNAFLAVGRHIKVSCFTPRVSVALKLVMDYFSFFVFYITSLLTLWEVHIMQWLISDLNLKHMTPKVHTVFY